MKKKNNSIFKNEKKIKFRAWVKEEQKLCDVLNMSINENGEVTEIRVKINGIPTLLYQGMFELTEYTGVNDIHNKEIFEGDLIKTHFQNVREEIELVNKNGNYLLYLNHATVYLCNRAVDYLTIEKVGNIFEKEMEK